MAWTFVTSGTELSPVRIEEVNVWDYEWRSTGRKADVIDPRYGQQFDFDVWSIKSGERTIEFAAGEFSNGVWGFYTDVR